MRGVLGMGGSAVVYIVHRDVKPGNILLAASGEVKLADSGLARHWEGTETRVTETENSRSEEPAPVALEAGRAFHLKGELARAISWYRRGLGGRDSHARGGHHPRDLAGGEILVLGEMGRWEDAAVEIDRFETAYPELASDVVTLRAYVAWRTLRRPQRFDDRDDDPGLHRYWRLEVRRVLGDAPATLLGEVDRLGRDTADVAPLLASLCAELLFDTGRVAEGRTFAAEAVADATREATADVGIRAHLPLVVERARRRGALAATPAGAAGRR